MNYDPRGNPVSCGNRTALDLYEKALLSYQTYVGDPIAVIDEALKAQPDFVLAYAFRAGALMTFSEQRFARLARETLNDSEKYLPYANDRERNLIAAAQKLVDGNWNAACQHYDKVLIAYPRDIFAAQTAHIYDFFRGDSLNLRNRVMRILPHWSPSVPGYSYLLGMYAFGLEECNQYPEAEMFADKALALEAKDAWAVHAGTHVREMKGNIDEGIAFLEERIEDWAPNNNFAYHNWWHLALFYLDRADYAKVLALYDQKVFPQEADFSLNLIDASALLWRLHLLNVDVGERSQRLADIWQRKLDDEKDFYAFNDIHALLTFFMAGREKAASQLIADLEALTELRNGPSNVAMTRDVGLPLARGLRAFAEGQWQKAIDEISLVRDYANRFGGSHAQRDLLTLTVIEAALRGGQFSLARHYISERNVSRPGSALGWRLQARSMAS